jgi:hypothetical protein
MRFSDFLREETNDLPVIVASPEPIDVSNADQRDSLNLALLDAIDEPLITVASGYAKIQQVMSEVGFPFGSLNIPGDADQGEDIYLLDETGHYLYVAFFADEQGYYEFHAEVVTEDELNEILSVED